MFKLVDGKTVEIPDDERITPELKELRSQMNTFLQFLSDTPLRRDIERQYREGCIGAVGDIGDWFKDPNIT